MYNIEQLKMFVETVETGSFSACGRKLGKVQSAVSQGIANLEIDLRIELFDRRTRKPRLTPEGLRLLDYAKSVLQQHDELSAAARSIHQGEELTLRLALEDALLLPQLSEILIRFESRFKATRVEILSAASPEIVAMVNQGRADIGLMFSELEFDQGVLQCYIGSLPFYAVCAPQHPLAALPAIDLKDLVPHRQLMLRTEQGQGLDLIPQFSTEIWNVSSFYSIRELVIQGVGWSYLPAHMVIGAIEEGRLSMLCMSFDHKPWSPPVDTVLSKSRAMGPALSWLSEEMKGLLPE